MIKKSDCVSIGKRAASVIRKLAFTAFIMATATPSITAYASTPSDTAYANPEQLMAFSTGDDGKETVGKLKLGKRDKSSSDTTKENLEWYILGSDSGVNGGEDNIAIFAASPIKYGEPFRDGGATPYWTSDVDGKYIDYEMTSGTEVDWNHYGIIHQSDMYSFRSVFLSLTGDNRISDIDDKYKGYFTDEEKSLLQVTTVQTDDWLHQVLPFGTPGVYETSDVLYAGNSTGGDLFFVGSDNQKNLYAPYYSDNAFWLRTPEANSTASYQAMAVDVDPYHTDPIWAHHISMYELGAQPASNIDLSKVKFASAAIPVSQYETFDSTGGIINSSDAMTLRLDGSGVAIGTIAMERDSTNENVIKVTKDASATGIVNVIVQGKGYVEDETGEKDWYFSKEILTDSAEISAAEINTAIKISTGMTARLTSDDLSDCKIWLETPVESGSTLAYALVLGEHTHSYDGKWTTDEDYHWHQCKDGVNCPNLADSIKDKNEHELSASLYHDSYYHYKKCTVCEAVDTASKAPHEIGTDGKCEECTYNIDEEHTLKEIPEEAPTCTKVGHEKYWKCERTGCDAKFRATEIGILVEFTDMSVIEKPTIDHTLSADYKHDTVNHWKECEICKAKINTEKHNFNGNKCTVCPYVKSNGNSARNSERYSSGSSSDGGSNGSGTSSAVIAMNGTWSKDAKGWRYQYSNGSFAKGTTTNNNGQTIENITWVRIGDKDFAFDSNGYMATGWVYDDARWYYCDENRGKLYSWFYDAVDGYWYYFDPKTGEMLTGWQEINGKSYFFALAPAATTYTFDAASSQWVYNNAKSLRPFGSMYAAATTPDNQSVDANGAKVG